MNLTAALEGFYLHLRAEGYSPATIDLYTYALTRLCQFLGDPDTAAVKAADLTRYFAWLRTEYTRRGGGSLSGSTLQNHWKAIRSFYNWAAVEFSLSERPDERLRLPENNPRIIQPLGEEDIRALLAAAEYTRESRPGNRRAFRMKRRTAARDTALIILLVDTGIRAGEAARLDVGDLDLEAGEISVKPFRSRRKTKGRILPLGQAARRALWRYLATRGAGAEKDAPLFTSRDGGRLDASGIRHLLVDLGKKAGVKNVHPHRLRHTFAIEYLRNGGDVFTLQRLLGHASLEMVNRYLNLLKADTHEAHRRASPADKWRL